MNITMDADSIIAQADRDFPALYQLLAGFFHQDWRDEVDSADAVVRSFISEAPPDAVSAARGDLDRLLGMGLDDASLTRVLADGFGCDYVPETDGATPARWLSHVRTMLGDGRRG